MLLPAAAVGFLRPSVQLRDTTERVMNTGGRTLEKLLAVPGLSASAINHLSIAPYAQANWIAGAPVKVGLGGKRKAADKRATKIAAAACYTTIVPKKALHYAADTLCRDAAIKRRGIYLASSR